MQSEKRNENQQTQNTKTHKKTKKKTVGAEQKTISSSKYVFF